ncbi:MAG: ABC transporter ATP-binding protein [Chlamydiales bacterium]
MSKVLQVRNLTTQLSIEGKTYTVVDNLSFDIERGEILALVGESGCGKSMTALSILRILPQPPALFPKGEVIFRGYNLMTLSESEMSRIRGYSIAMIFQDPMSALNPVYSIGEQLREVAARHLEIEKEAIEERIIKVLEDVRLPNPKERMREYPHQMSGGMLQRVMIAMALIGSPDLLIADEATTALDVTIQAQILDLLKELQQKKEMSILMITHNMGVVAEIADRVIVMYAGEQIEQAQVEHLFENPAHPYTQALLSAHPNSSLMIGRWPTISGNVPKVTDLPQGCSFHPRCHYQMNMCTSGKVPFFPLPEKEHQAKCWLYDKKLKWKLANEEVIDD